MLSFLFGHFFVFQPHVAVAMDGNPVGWLLDPREGCPGARLRSGRVSADGEPVLVCYFNVFGGHTWSGAPVRGFDPEGGL